MQFPAAGESAAQLPWLWPDAQSLITIGQPLSEGTWPTVLHDPALLLLALRQPAVARLPDPRSALHPFRFLDPALLDATAELFRHDQGVCVDWRQPSIWPVYRTSLAIAYQASIICRSVGAGEPSIAWAMGLLAPLGWLAMAAVAPKLVAAVLSDPNFANDPLETQQRVWGIDQTALASHLARRWRLPNWLRAAALDQPDWPTRVSIERDAVCLAIRTAERAGFSLGLGQAIDEPPIRERLRLSEDDAMILDERFHTLDLDGMMDREWIDPRAIAGLEANLRVASCRRRQIMGPLATLFEHDTHLLRSEIERSRDENEERLRQAKLEALAEFAAGASHEINNPLAVIAGQGQYLLKRQPDDRQRQALESIVRQARRINGILSELMQFARPPRIVAQRVALPEIVRKATDDFRQQALAAEVSLKCDLAEEPVWIDGDPRQLQTAIGCLLRNAIEATAASKGWVRIGVGAAHGRAEVQITDSGPGLTPAQREHMFDPFYSGRPAGRGRGLGLPTAWRLAREHGGNVVHVANLDEPTCFTLLLPLADQARRMSA